MSKNKNQNPVAEEAKKLTSEDAKMMLEKERQDRVAKCRETIQNALAEYKCTIDCQVVLSVNGVNPVINIIATE